MDHRQVVPVGSVAPIGRIAPVFTAVFLIVSLQGVEAVAGPSPPNLVVIMADDLGYADLGCYGSTVHRTPHIDRLAREGVRFTDFYVTTSVCTPTRAALLTGRFPRRCNSPGVLWPTTLDKSLPAEEITLAEILQENGYATHLSGKWHLGHGRSEHLPTGHGFDSWYGMPYPNDMAPEHPQTGYRNEIWPEMPMMENDRVVERPIDVNRLTQQYTADAVRFIAAHHHRPFFLYLAHAMTHAILGASPEFVGASSNGLYGDAVQEVDWSTGEILRVLRAFGLEERTLVIFTNDNGGVLREQFWNQDAAWFHPDGTFGSNHPLRGGKQTTFEGGVRVPGIFRWPGTIRAGVTESTPAIITDVFSTFLDYAGIFPTADRVYDGRTLRPLLEGTGLREPSDFFFGGSRVTAVRSGDWKLQLAQQPRWMKPPLADDQPLLFDVRKDPGEINNLASAHPEVVADLLERIRVFERDTPAP